jgi:hypothetical protein
VHTYFRAPVRGEEVGVETALLFTRGVMLTCLLYIHLATFALGSTQGASWQRSCGCLDSADVSRRQRYNSAPCS